MSAIYSEQLQELVGELGAFFINGWIPIAQTTLTASAASVTFSNIPQIFRTLVLVVQARSDRVAETDNTMIRFNNDTGNNYDTQYLRANGGNPQGGVMRAWDKMWLDVLAGATSRASNFDLAIANISGYKETDREKWLISEWATYGNVSADTDMFTGIISGRWRNTNAISSITLFPFTGPNFVANSIFQLYGIL